VLDTYKLGGHMNKMVRCLVVSMFCGSLFVICTFSFGHCVVCSSIYGFWYLD
jgi:hypothetical protein